MKKVLLIALAFIAIQATAQERKQDGPQKERKNKSEQLHNLSADDIATLKTKKMTLHLDLNASQQKEIQKLNLENATAMKAKMEAHKVAKESGTAQKPSQEERVKMMNAKLDHQIAMKAKMKTILNAEQYGKWEKVEMRKGSKNKGSRKHKGDRKEMQNQG